MRLSRHIVKLPVAACVLALAHGAAYGGIDDDPRGARPGRPASLTELAERFLPHMVWVGERRELTLAEGEVENWVIYVDAGVCYGVIALGEGIGDVDVRVTQDEQIVAQDAQLDDYPVVEWCPDADGTARVAVRAFRGGGQVEVATLVDPDTREAATGAFDELTNRLVAHIGRAAPGWSDVGPQWRSQFDQPGVASFELTIAAGTCGAVAAVGTSGIEDVDLRLRIGASEVSRDFALDTTPVVVHCADGDTVATVDVAVRAGAGAVAAQRLSAPGR